MRKKKTIKVLFLYDNFFIDLRAVVVMIVWQFVLQLPMQSVPIATNVVSSNLVHGELYSIQHYAIKFVSDLWQVSSFLQVLLFPSQIKLTATI
jgi:hypothetical protein